MPTSPTLPERHPLLAHLSAEQLAQLATRVTGEPFGAMSRVQPAPRSAGAGSPV